MSGLSHKEPRPAPLAAFRLGRGEPVCNDG